ncbi:MAG: hypothetical protein BroJett011_73420 [Chloroflexota bacterium]|nr:MAG: hypothetical protein BroJett011_73420 [Chloroflexota bacterium]
MLADNSSSISPRPLERVDLAKETAYKNLAEKLSKQCGLDEAQAKALARACVDPTEVRNQLDRPLTKRFPGGFALVVEALIYTPAISASPINPRESETRVYPIATLPGEPIVAPLQVEPAKSGAPVICLTADSRSHMETILNHSEGRLRSDNIELRHQIELDGILEPLTVVLAELTHRNGDPAVVIPITIDGSTRATHCHYLTSMTSTDVVYKWTKADSRAWRGILSRKLMVQDQPLAEVNTQELTAHRAMVAPARIIIGLQPVRDGEPVDIVTASRAIVGQIHVGHPKEWPQGAQNDEIAEAVLDRLVLDCKINPEERNYLAGNITRSNLQSLGFSEHPDIRAARIAHVLYNEKNESSISAGYRSLVAKPRLGPNDKPNIVAELMLRAFRTHYKLSELQSLRSILQRTIDLPEWRNDTSKWKVRPDCSPDEILAQALKELKSNPGQIGPASLELGILGTYWLISKQALQTDIRGSSDRRGGTGVIRAMLQTERGLRQLHRAILDGRANTYNNQKIRAVATDGNLLPLAAGDYAVVDNLWLRETFSYPKDEIDQGSDESDIAKLNRALLKIRDRIEDLSEIIQTISPIGGREGVDKPIVDEFRQKLRKIDDEFGLWGLVASSKRGQPYLIEDTELDAEEVL